MTARGSRRKRKRRSGLDKYLVFSFAVLLAYTAVSVVLFWKTGLEMTTLTTCLYAAFGGEVLCCALIKKLKLKEKEGGGGAG